MTTYGPPTKPGSHAGTYLQRQLEQADGAQHLLLLLDGLARFTLQAKEAIGRNDIAGRHRANARAMEITSFLLGQLDPDKGDEAAARLLRIYGGLLQRQLRIDFDNSPEVCDEVVQLIRQLRSGFASLNPAAPTVVTAPDGAPRPLKLTASA